MAKILQISFLVLAGALAAAASCPSIVPRAGWSSRATRFVEVLPIRPTPLVVVHPTGTAPCLSQSECSAALREIQTFHVDVNGWPDISYHFIIGGDLRIYAGRGWGRMGANVGAFSNQAINVGLVGRFTDAPSAEVLAALDSLIACGIAERALPSNVGAVAQCQVTPMVSCDATTIFETISGHPRFESNPRPV